MRLEAKCRSIPFLLKVGGCFNDSQPSGLVAPFVPEASLATV